MEIRKADSKGRVTGFRPNLYYAVESTKGGDVTAKCMGSRPDMYLLLDIKGTRKISKSAREYVSGFGISPNEVNRTTVCPEGYSRFVFDGDGRRKFVHGQAIEEPTPWPEGFDWDVFAKLILEEGE